MLDTTVTHQLILLDYSKLLGTAVRFTPDSLFFRMHAAAEVSAFPAEQVRYLGVYQPKFNPDDEQFASSAPGFQDLTYERTALPFQEKARFKIINLLYLGTEFALNDNFEVGVGLAPVGLLLTQRARVSITPKVHVGVSNQSIYFPFFGNTNRGGTGVLVGDVTALLTLGDDRGFLNIGSGYFYNTDVRNERIFLQRLAAGGRVSKYWHLYAEAMASLNRRNDDAELYPSFTAAYGKRRHRWRFGVFTVYQQERRVRIPPLPYVGYTRYW
ncbi:hypothetical protein A3850_011215 [Lewinella sp. 4G2]|nr:hypothetical protein A3850_011215 [Lewinella sp. 4G2]